MSKEYLNIVDYNKCIGCAACRQICPVQAISAEDNNEGFSYPIVDLDKCIGCKACYNVCPVVNKVQPKIPEYKAYAGYWFNREKLKKSSSGGAASALSEKIIKANGVVFGCNYSQDYKAVQYSSATTLEELEKFKGSKYVQSVPPDYLKIKDLLETNVTVLFIGLPCQVAAVKKFVVRDYENLYTVALICHGPTSQSIHKKFIENLEFKYHSKIVSFTVRYKKKNASLKYIKAEFENGKKTILPWASSAYAYAFDMLLRKSCYDCKFKLDSSPSDIIVGDFWGVECRKELYNKMGVSVIISCTEKGTALVKSIDDFVLKEVDLKFAIKKNGAAVASSKESPQREYYVNRLKTDNIIDIFRDSLGLSGIAKLRFKDFIKFVLPDAVAVAIKRYLYDK